MSRTTRFEEHLEAQAMFGERVFSPLRFRLLVAARQSMQVPQIAAKVLPMMGYGWQRGGKPITARDVDDELRRLCHQLEALEDLIAVDRALWTAGHRHAHCCPGATLLADPLSR